ncbi:MAG: clostripain-related cysteine peptidase, partial [Thermoplasmatota archaeon]
MMEIHRRINRFGGSLGPIRGKTMLSLIAIVVMAMVLLTSIGIFLLIDDPEPIDPGNTGSEKGPLSLEITFIPQQLRSGMQEEVKGLVTDDMGVPVRDATITLNFTSDSDDTYRTTTGPDGTFILPFWSPRSDSNTTYSFNLVGEKDGYDAKSIPMELEVLSPLEWTVMIYMSDCDLEEYALEDINEMESITKGSHLNMVVQLDRWESPSPSDDRSDGNWTSTKRFLIDQDDDPLSIGSTELEDIGEINTADPDQLVDFTLWSIENFPADRYALILWNHGSGIDGICWEQSIEDEDVITIDELGGALSEITGDIGKPLDIIGFDACLMSTIEVAYETRAEALEETAAGARAKQRLPGGVTVGG